MRLFLNSTEVGEFFGRGALAEKYWPVGNDCYVLYAHCLGGYILHKQHFQKYPVTFEYWTEKSVLLKSPDFS